MGRLYILKMSFLLNSIYRFNIITIRFPESYFLDIDKLRLKFPWKGKRLRIANTVLRKKNKFGELENPISRLTIKLQ